MFLVCRTVCNTGARSKSFGTACLSMRSAVSHGGQHILAGKNEQMKARIVPDVHC